MSPLVIVTMAATVLMVAAAEECSADISSFRSEFVQAQFNNSLMLGQWYEQAYHDIAQIGSRCESLSGTFAPTGELVLGFSVDYGPIPFTISEHYFDKSPREPGHFTKKVVVPGGKKPSNLIKPDVVFLDVVGDASGYEAVSLYGCSTELGKRIPELQILSRQKELPAAVLDQLIDGFRQRGIDFKKMKRVDWSNCKSKKKTD